MCISLVKSRWLAMFCMILHISVRPRFIRGVGSFSTIPDSYGETGKWNAAHAYTHRYAHVFIHTYMHVWVYTHMHAHTHTHTHTHTHNVILIRSANADLFYHKHWCMSTFRNYKNLSLTSLHTMTVYFHLISGMRSHWINSEESRLNKTALHTHTHTHTHLCTHAHTHTHLCMHTHTHTCVHTHAHVCAHTHTHTHTQMHTANIRNH